MELIESSVATLVEQVRTKKISARELTQLHIDQINKVNSKLNAIVQFNPERALADAAKLDERQAKGELAGPLHGVPFTLKDVYNTKGDIVTAGSLGLKDNVANEDATIVKRLKNAGAVLLGKTNTPEFENACDTNNLVYGKTINPYDLQRSAGGSSGGAAASVTACCSAFDIGADYGGSLRLPAHYNGLATLRSTPHRVPSSGTVYGLRTGVAGMFISEGPLCRYVDDVDLIMSVIQGPDGFDPKVVTPLPPMPAQFEPSKLNIAYFDDDGIAAVTADTKAMIKTAADQLAQAGATVTNERPPRFDEGFEIFKQFVGADGLAGFKTLLKNFKVPQCSSLLTKIMQRLESYNCDIQTFAERWNCWEWYRSDMLKFFDNYDAFICPMTPAEAITHDKTMWDADQINNISYSWAVSATLFPVAVVRVGTSQSGLPMGVQIVTKPYMDNSALLIAKMLETALGGWKRSHLV